MVSLHEQHGPLDGYFLRGRGRCRLEPMGSHDVTQRHAPEAGLVTCPVNSLIQSKLRDEDGYLGHEESL